MIFTDISGKYVSKAFVQDPTSSIQLTARNPNNIQDLKSLGNHPKLLN